MSNRSSLGIVDAHSDRLLNPELEPRSPDRRC